MRSNRNHQRMTLTNLTGHAFDERLSSGRDCGCHPLIQINEVHLTLT